MSDFERRVACVSRQEIGKFAERLLPDQCPDLKPLIDMTTNVLRLSQDIKSEIAMLDSYVRNTSQAEKQQNDEEKDELLRKIVQDLLDQLNSSDQVSDGIPDTLRDIFNQWLSNQISDFGLQWEEVLTIARTIMSLLQGYKLSKLYDALGGLAAPANISLAFASIHKTLEQVENLREWLDQLLTANKEDIDSKLSDIAESLGGLTTDIDGQNEQLRSILIQTQINHDDINNCHELLEFLTEADSVIQQSLRDLAADIDGKHEALVTYMKSIYDKLVECCVVEDVSNLDAKVTDMRQVLDHVSDTLAGGTPTSTRNAQGEIMTQLRVIQGQVEEIRRLL